MRPQFRQFPSPRCHCQGIRCQWLWDRDLIAKQNPALVSYEIASLRPNSSSVPSEWSSDPSEATETSKVHVPTSDSSDSARERVMSGGYSISADTALCPSQASTEFQSLFFGLVLSATWRKWRKAPKTPKRPVFSGFALVTISCGIGVFR